MKHEDIKNISWEAHYGISMPFFVTAYPIEYVAQSLGITIEEAELLKIKVIKEQQNNEHK